MTDIAPDAVNQNVTRKPWNAPHVITSAALEDTAKPYAPTEFTFSSSDQGGPHS